MRKQGRGKDIACKCKRIQLMQNGCCRAAIQRKGRAPHSQNRRAAVYAVELINGSEERMYTAAVHATKEQDMPLAKDSLELWRSFTAPTTSKFSD